MDLKLKVLAINSSDNYVIFKITGQENFFTQIPSGVVKMTWNDRTGRIKAKKLLDGKPAASFQFQLYDDSNCVAGNEIRKIKTSDTNGIVVWKNLEFGDYSVKEVNCDSNKYTCDTICRNRHLGKSDKIKDKDEEAYIDNELVNNPFKNTTIVHEYYGYVYKYDEETMSPIDGATIGVYSDNSCTTYVGNITSGAHEISGYALAWFSTYYNDGYYYAKEEIPPDGYENNTNCIPIPVHEYPGGGQYPIYGNSETVTNEALMPEKKIKYCIAVAKKDAVTGAFLNGASFEVKKGEETVAPADNLDFLGLTDDNGNLVSDGYGGWAAYGPFDKDTSLTITEIKPPEAYTINSSFKNVSAGVPATNGVCPNSLAAYENGTSSIAVFENEKDFINWYKVAEDGETKISGAEFVVREKGTDNYIYFDKNENKQKISTTDSNGVSKSCYLKKGSYNPDVSSSEDKLAAVSASKEEYVMISDTSGEVCLTGLDSNKEYEVIETKPGKYHTFGSSNTKTFISSPSLQPMSSDNKFINYPTKVTFKKLVTSGNTDALWNKVTTEELKRIPFQIYKKELNENGEIVYNQLIFIEKEDGTYHYANNELDGITGERVSYLYIKDNNRNFTIYHLPVGEYILTENGQQSTSLEKCPCTNSNLLCSGFYTPGPIDFEVTECSGATATSGKKFKW